MKRIWIHIGMPKTGTTSVQSYLAKNRTQPGWQYIALGSSPDMNREMHAMFGTKPHRWYWFAKRGDSPEQIAELGAKLRKQFAEAIRNCREENILVSSEALSLIEKPGIVALRDFLSGLCDEIRIIAYVRPPVGFMVSFFQQRLKNGGTNFDLGQVPPTYRNRFEKFDAVFGRENVILKKFEPSRFPNHCFVAEFCQQLGMPVPSEIVRVNESLSREACGILYAYRKFGSDFGVGRNVISENNYIVGPLLAMEGTKFKVARSLVNPSIDHEDVAWMEARLGESLHESQVEDGTEIASEEDLLGISRKSCEIYAEKFRKIHQVAVAKDRMPKGDSPDPRDVAGFVDYLRGLGRRKLAAKHRGKKGTGRVCYLHIGMHKTGSTSIQKNLSKRGISNGWSYISLLGTPNLSQAIYMMFASDPHKLHWFAKKGETAQRIMEKGERLRAKLGEAIRKCGEGKVVISGEGLTLLDHKGLGELRKFLQPLFDEIFVIGYVRPPIGFKVSAFQQQIKHGASEFCIGDFQPSYRKRFRKFDMVFGRSRVILRKFDPASFKGRDVVMDFCDQIGIQPPDTQATKRVNESLCREACGILYAYRKFGPGYGVGEDVVRENTMLIAPLLKMTGRRFNITRSLVERGMNRRDLQWMERRLGESLDEVIVNDGTEILSESDLLRISGAECAAYAEEFEKMYGHAIDKSKVPVGDVIDPREVAGFVDYLRGWCRERLRAERSMKNKQVPFVLRRLRAVLRWGRRVLAGG